MRPLGQWYSAFVTPESGTQQSASTAHYRRGKVNSRARWAGRRVPSAPARRACAVLGAAGWTGQRGRGSYPAAAGALKPSGLGERSKPRDSGGERRGALSLTRGTYQRFGSQDSLVRERTNSPRVSGRIRKAGPGNVGAVVSPPVCDVIELHK